MKRLLVLLCLILTLGVVLIGCGDGTTASSEQSTLTSNKSESTVTDESVDTESSVETDESVDTESSVETDESIDTESSVETDESIDTESSVETDESVDTEVSSDTESSVEDIPPVDIEPDDDPGIPDMKIDIAIDGLSSYVVVYEDDDIRVTEFATKFVEYMNTTHKISLSMVGDSVGTDSEYCIYVGDVFGTGRVKARLNGANDFGACVSGNDYVLYATNYRLYEYLYDILVDELLFTLRGGDWSADPKYDFIYHASSFKDTSYVDYVIEKNGGTLTQDILNKFFEPRTFVASDETTLVYRIYVPYDYDTSKEYPFLTFLHGAGERGNNNTGNMKHMMLNWFSLENSPFWDSIIIAPQCPDGQQWVDTPWEDGGYSVDEVPESNELKAVMEIIDMVENSFPTDKERYYVTGLSMGGFGTWDVIMRHYDRFAAAVPLCGGGDYRYAKYLVDKPIYTIHDIKDSTVPFVGTRDMIVALETLGSTVFRYEEVSGYGHNVWSYASQKAEIWTWLFEQKLD